MTQAGPGGVTRWKMIYDWLRSELPRFEYGSNFYTAREICKRFNVSIITANRSLGELAQEGLIETIQGKGSVVRSAPREVSLWVVQAPGHGEEHQPFDSIYVRRLHGFRQAAQRPGIEMGTIGQPHLQSLFPREGGLCGFLVPQPVHRETVAFLAAHRLPYILVDPYDEFERQPHVRLDRVSVGLEAVRHLVALGHRRIAWLTTGSRGPNFHQRLKGYRSGLTEAGIRIDPALIVHAADQRDGSVTHETVQAALDRLLRLRRPPTAIIACDDPRVIYLLEACRRRGIDVPGDLSVLAHPDYSEFSLTTPPLTVVDGQYEEVGEIAVRLLLEQIFQGADPKLQAVEVNPVLIDRSSTGPAPDRAATDDRVEPVEAGRSR